MWVVRNDTLTTELVDEGFVSIGWDELGDLRQVGLDRESIKAALTAAQPDRKPRSIAGQAGSVFRFASEMSVGDLVVAPYSLDGTINFGRVAGPYEYVEQAPTHRHRRRVTWLQTGIARAIFTEGALHEIGSMLTVFRIRRHVAEFTAVAEAGEAADLEEVAVRAAAVPAPQVVPEPLDEDEEDSVAQEPRASRIERHTRDFVLKALKNELTPNEFEEFTAALLQAMGYEARATVYSHDGGVDVVAHRDPLGVEPPVLKVQCKQMTSAIGAPEVQKLMGAQAMGEMGVFVTLGGYTREALAIERQRQGLRLLDGEELVGLVLRHYDQLAPAWRLRIPLRSVLVVDDVADA